MPTKTVKAVASDIRIAPRKVSLVASLVRGRSLADALVILEHTPKRAAKPLAKLLSSAKANAINNHNVVGDGLIIETLSVTAGSRLKRYRPAAHGRALPFQRKSSNIVVIISGNEKVKKTTTTNKTKETK